MRGKIIDLSEQDAFTKAGYREALKGATGKFFIGQPDDNGWCNVYGRLDEPVIIDGEPISLVIFYKAKIEEGK